MISFNKRFPKTDAIWIFSNPKIAQQKAFDIYGPDAILNRSNTKQILYCIPRKQKNKILDRWGVKTTPNITMNLARRSNYLHRTSQIRGDWKQNKYSPNNLSRTILW